MEGQCAASAPGAPPSAELGLVAGRSLGAPPSPESLLLSPAAPEPSFQGGTLSLQCHPPAAASGPEGAGGVIWPFGGHSLCEGCCSLGTTVSHAGEDGVGRCCLGTRLAISKPGALDLAASSYFRFSARFCCLGSLAAAPRRGRLLSLMSPVAEGGRRPVCGLCSSRPSGPLGARCPWVWQPSPFGHLHAGGFCSGRICEVGALLASCGRRVLTSLPLRGRPCPVKVL